MKIFMADMEAARQAVIRWLISLVVMFTLLECLRPPKFGAALRGEWNLWTMGAASVEFAVAATALICAGLAYYAKRRRIIPDSMWIVWLIVAAGFQFFVFDETLEFHERVGKLIQFGAYGGILKNFRPHNLIEGIYFLFALGLAMVVIRRIRTHKAFLRYFIFGLLLCGVEISLGVLPRSAMSAIYSVIPFHFPELFKMAGVTCLVCAFITLAFQYINQIGDWLVHTVAKEDAVEHVLAIENHG